MNKVQLEYLAFKYAQKRNFSTVVVQAFEDGYNYRVNEDIISKLKELKKTYHNFKSLEEVKKETKSISGLTETSPKLIYNNYYNEYIICKAIDDLIKAIEANKDN